MPIVLLRHLGVVQIPIISLSTISGTPVMFVEITGSFIAIASIRALGVISLLPSSAMRDTEGRKHQSCYNN